MTSALVIVWPGDCRSCEHGESERGADDLSAPLACRTVDLNHPAGAAYGAPARVQCGSHTRSGRLGLYARIRMALHAAGVLNCTPVFPSCRNHLAWFRFRSLVEDWNERVCR